MPEDTPDVVGPPANEQGDEISALAENPFVRALQRAHIELAEKISQKYHIQMKDVLLGLRDYTAEQLQSGNHHPLALCGSFDEMEARRFLEQWLGKEGYEFFNPGANNHENDRGTHASQSALAEDDKATLRKVQEWREQIIRDIQSDIPHLPREPIIEGMGAYLAQFMARQPITFDGVLQAFRKRAFRTSILHHLCRGGYCTEEEAFLRYSAYKAEGIHDFSAN